MAWDLDGVNQYAQFAMPVAVQAAAGGPFTIAALVYLDSTTDGAVVHTMAGTSSRIFLEVFASWNYGTSAGTRTGPAATSGAWYIVIVSKDTGNVAPEYTLIPLATGTPVSGTITGGGVTLGDGISAGATGVIQVGRWGTSGTEYIDGRVSAAAIMLAFKNQAAREALTTWALWLAAAGIAWAIRLNTLSTISDATGNGGNETGRFGTASITLAADPGALAIDFYAVGGAVNDTSGGGAAGSSPGTVQAGVVRPDGSGGMSGGGSPGTVLTGVVRADVSGGSGGSGSPETVLVGVVVPDTSGGGSAGPSASLTPLVGVAVPDPSGGGSGGSSPDAAAAGIIAQDGSGGGSAGGQQDVGASATVVNDVSGGGTAASTPETLIVGVVIQDGSGGGSASYSPGGLVRDVVVNDVSGGGVSAGSGSTTAASVLVQDGSGGAGAAFSAGLVDGSPDVTIQDSSGGAGAGSSPPATQTPTVVRDTMVMPVLLSTLACLQDEAAKVENPPAIYTIRPGDAFEPSADPWTDECCAGVAWVRMMSSYETYNFPEPASVMEGGCPPHSWAVAIEVGINRCVPVAGDMRGAIVTPEQWLAAAQAQSDDGAALRRVLCCLRELYDVADVTAGQVNPLPLQANCGGVVLTITVRRDACDCHDPLSAH